MARDHIARALLDPGSRIVQDAPGHFRDAPARIAADVLMVVFSHLVIGLAVAKVDATDGALAFHQRDSAEHARIVGRAQRSAYDLMQLVDGPRVPRFALEDIAHGVGDGTWTRHSEIIIP